MQARDRNDEATVVIITGSRGHLQSRPRHVQTNLGGDLN
jgi:hypothetical protein